MNVEAEQVYSRCLVSWDEMDAFNQSCRRRIGLETAREECVRQSGYGSQDQVTGWDPPSSALKVPEA